VPTLRQAVELAPTSSGAMLDLGAALVEVQDFAAAAPELAEAVALLCMRPSTAAAACQREIEQYNQTLENNPDAYAANLLLALLCCFRETQRRRCRSWRKRRRCN